MGTPRSLLNASMFSGSSAALPAGPSGRPDIGRPEHLARQHAHGLPDLLAEHGAAHGAHHADQRACDALHLLGEHVAHRRPHALRHGVDELLPRGQGRLDPLGAAPGHGGVRAGGERGHAVQPEVGQPHRLVDGRALRGAHARVLRPVGSALRDRLAGDLLGHVPVDGTALEAEHLAQLLEGRTQVVGVHRSEHRGERIVSAARAARLSEPEITEGVAGTSHATGTLTTSGRVLLLAVAVLRLLRRKAESEWGVTHGFPRLVGPPASRRRRLPDYTTQPKAHRAGRGDVAYRCPPDTAATPGRLPGSMLRRPWPAAGWTSPGTYASFTHVLKTTAGDAR